MCLAVPVRILELYDDGLARCQVGESQTYITASTMLLPDAPKLGDYLIVHAGFALRILNPDDAQETLRLLQEIASSSPITT